ncbi:MAG TPA: DUF6647 family protein [Burkholderiales bacterium]|nr:DUF6647 family protein [Burkholderiales bacterium]
MELYLAHMPQAPTQVADRASRLGPAPGRIGWLAALLLGCMISLSDAAPPSADPQAVPVTEDLEPVIRALFAAIEMLSDYRAPDALPPVFQLPQPALEAKICDEPCNVTAAYVPREGIYLAANLDPAREPLDRAALLHELVHSLQQGHPKFAQMAPCERERAKEQEAYAIQNAYLAMIGSRERVVFYAGDFDCGGEAPGRSQ